MMDTVLKAMECDKMVTRSHKQLMRQIIDFVSQFEMSNKKTDRHCIEIKSRANEITLEMILKLSALDSMMILKVDGSEYCKFYAFAAKL